MRRLGSRAFGTIRLLAIFVVFLLPVSNQAAVSNQREVNDTIRLPSAPPMQGYSLTNAFGALTFDHPVALAAPPGETNRLFVVERPGRIVVITNLAAPTKTIFLDISQSTYSSYIEAGLLGLAFHPGYRTNRYFYVYRTLITSSDAGHNALHDQLSRFESSPADPNVALPDSELR